MSGRIAVGGESMYREELASQGFIPTLKFEVGKLYMRSILKSAIKPNGTYYDGLPSWLFFEEFTGVTVQIPEAGILEGQFPYKVAESALDNIIRYVEEVKGKENSDELLTQMLEAPLIKANGTVVLETLKSPETLKALVQAEIAKFIKVRTEAKTLVATVLSTNDNSEEGKKFSSGTIPTEEEDGGAAIKTARKLSSFFTDLTKARFKQKYPDLKEGSEIYKKELKEYRNKQQPISSPSKQAIIFAVEAATSTALELIKDDASGELYKLGYYDLGASETKLNKIAAAKAVKDADRFLDYIPLLFKYNTGNDKKSVGQTFGVDRWTEIPDLTPEEVWKYFSKVLNPKSYVQCAKFREYDMDSMISFLANWLESRPHVKESISTLLTSEQLQKHEEAIQILMGTTTSMDIDDIVNDVAGMAAQPAPQQAQPTPPTGIPTAPQQAPPTGIPTAPPTGIPVPPTGLPQ